MAASLVSGEHRRLAALDNVLGPSHRVRRIDRRDLTAHEPVEQHRIAARCWFTVDLALLSAPFDIGRNMDRLDVRELTDPVLLDPGKEVARGPVMGHARVAIADTGGDELGETARLHRRRRSRSPMG